MPFGDRRSERVRMEHSRPVNLMGVDGTWRRSCVLLDVSATGARLEVEGTLEVLGVQEFFLLLSSTGLAYRRCELSWVNGDQIGVNFLRPADKKKRPNRRTASQDAEV